MATTGSTDEGMRGHPAPNLVWVDEAQHLTLTLPHIDPAMYALLAGLDIPEEVDPEDVTVCTECGGLLDKNGEHL